MAGATVTTLTPVLLQQIASQIFDSVYKYQGVYPILPKRPGFVAGSAYTFPARIAGNSSVEKFSSADPTPAAGYQQTLLVTTEWQNYRVLIRLEGDARRAAGAKWNDQRWVGIAGGQNIEVVGGLDDLASYMGEDSLSTAKHGVDGQVNNSVNVWDRDPSTYTTLACTAVDASSQDLSISLLNELLKGCRGAGKGGTPKYLLLGDTQVWKYDNMVAGKLANDGAKDVSGSAGGGRVPFSGCKPINIPGLAAAIVLAIDPMHWEVINHEPENDGVDVLDFGPTADAKVQQVVMSNIVCNHKPWRDGRLHTLKTT